MSAIVTVYSISRRSILVVAENLLTCTDHFSNTCSCMHNNRKNRTNAPGASGSRLVFRTYTNEDLATFTFILQNIHHMAR